MQAKNNYSFQVLNVIIIFFSAVLIGGDPTLGNNLRRQHQLENQTKTVVDIIAHQSRTTGSEVGDDVLRNDTDYNYDSDDTVSPDYDNEFNSTDDYNNEEEFEVTSVSIPTNNSQTMGFPYQPDGLWERDSVDEFDEEFPATDETGMDNNDKETPHWSERSLHKDANLDRHETQTSKQDRAVSRETQSQTTQTIKQHANVSREIQSQTGQSSKSDSEQTVQTQIHDDDVDKAKPRANSDSLSATNLANRPRWYKNGDQPNDDRVDDGHAEKTSKTEEDSKVLKDKAKHFNTFKFGTHKHALTLNSTSGDTMASERTGPEVTSQNGDRNDKVVSQSADSFTPTFDQTRGVNGGPVKPNRNTPPADDVEDLLTDIRRHGAAAIPEFQNGFRDASGMKDKDEDWLLRKKAHTNRPLVKDCQGCSKQEMNIWKARKLREQVLRAQLLDKLRLTPRFKQSPWPPKLPDQVFPDYLQRDQSDPDYQYYAKPTQLIVFGRDLGRHRLRRAATGSYQFGVAGKIRGSVTSAELWLYKMSDSHDPHGQTLVVTELHFSKSKRLRERSLVARTETHVKEGWVRFDVTRLVQRWVKTDSPASNQLLAIRCKTCVRTNYRSIFGVKSNFRPVLVVHEDNSRSRGHVRRTLCDPATNCCKFQLYVPFRDIGIHEIFYPRAIKADYCYGTCNRLDLGYFNHTVMVQRYRWSSSVGLNASMHERLAPCCVPVVLKEASIMYYLNDGLDTQVSVVPNLLVEKCGCA